MTSQNEDVRSVLTELLRLYDWRNEIGRIERDFNHDKKQVKTWLNQYGREKKAAWEAAVRVLSTSSSTPQNATMQAHDLHQMIEALPWWGDVEIVKVSTKTISKLKAASAALVNTLLTPPSSTPASGETPRTDAEIKRRSPGQLDVTFGGDTHLLGKDTMQPLVSADFARQLERELAESKETIAQLASASAVERGAIFIGYPSSASYAIVPKWVPVRERMPESEKSLLFVDNGSVEFGWYESDSSRGWRICNAGYDGDSGPAEKVTHWMPLPSAPTDDTGEKNG